MINIFAPINNLGYGIHSNNMIKSFIENDIDINLSTIGQIQSDPYFDKYWRSAHDRRTSFQRSAPSLHIFHSEYANQFCGDPMVNFCVFETTKLPDETINLLKQMDMVFTTTQDHKEILEDNGLRVPIHVVHEGVDSNLYNTNDCESWINTGKFTFITVGKHEKRKNTDLIIRSYIETLQYQESALICHTLDPFFDRRKNDVPFPGYTDIDPRKYGYTDMQQTDKYVKVSNGVSDIYFTKPINSAIYMRSLYRSSNVGIALSRAEGWDLPCHLPGSKIITLGGIKNIEDVIDRDKLLTHRGNFKDVLMCMKKPNKNKIIRSIKCWSNVDEMKLTPEHPVYAIKKRNIKKYKDIYNIEPEWINAENIKKGDVIIKAIPKQCNMDTVIDLVNIPEMHNSNFRYDDTYVWYKYSYRSSVSLGEWSYTTLSNKLNTKKHIIESAFDHFKNNTTPIGGTETYRIYNELIDLGLYPKENIRFNRYVDIKYIASMIGLYSDEGSDDTNKITFSIHKNELSTVFPMIQRCLTYISPDANIWVKKNKDSKGIDVCVGGRIISILFKKLCGSLAHNKKIPMQLVLNDIEILKEMVCWCVFGDGSHYKNQIKYSSVSEQLTNQLAISLERLGFCPNISKSRDEFNIVTTITKSNRGRTWKHKYGIAKLVKYNKAEDYDGNVYNFSVDTDNSYTMCTGTTHNCMEMMACGIPTIISNTIGHKEYIKDLPSNSVQGALIIDPAGMEVAEDGKWFMGNRGDWAVIDKDSFSTVLEDVYDDMEMYQRPDPQLSKYFHDNFSWSIPAKQVSSILY